MSRRDRGSGKSKTPRVHRIVPKKRDDYRVEYCPHCGGHFEILRLKFIEDFAKMNRSVTFPPDVCVFCGLDRNDVTIHATT
jgi:hypothetical protein